MSPGAPAHADPLGLLVRGSADAPVSPDRIAPLIGEAARAAGTEVVERPFERARHNLERGAVPAERLAAFARAHALLREGWAAYLAVDPGLAEIRLAEARLAAEPVLDLDGGVELYADIALRQGAVQLQLGRAGDAAAAFRLARSLDPDREVSITSFAPDVVRAVRDAVTAEPVAFRIRVVTEPAGARVEINGRYTGPAPASATVTAGRHVIVARMPGRAAYARELTLAAPAGGDHVEHAITLAPDPEAAAVSAGPLTVSAGREAREVQTALAGVIRYGELSGVAIIASVWRRGAPALLGQLCADIPVRCTRIVEVGYARAGDATRAAAELWRSLADADRTGPASLLADRRLVRPESRPRAREDTPDRPRRCRWCRSPWLWLGVGAAATVAGAAWLIARDRDIAPEVTFDPCGFGGCTP